MQLLNFAMMPAHLQIPTAAGISFVWTIILSMMRGKMDGDEQPEAQLPVHCFPAAADACLLLASTGTTGRVQWPMHVPVHV